MQKIGLTLILLFAAGCAKQNPEFTLENPPANYTEPDPYTLYNIDELLIFGEKMSGLNSNDRAEQCRTLLKYQSESPGAGIQLHIMVARLLSDACGEIPKILEDVAAIDRDSIFDDRVQKLIIVDTEALKRMNPADKKLVVHTRKPKAAQNALDAKNGAIPETPDAKTDETQLLREKLEAIRTIEKQIDENGNTN